MSFNLNPALYPYPMLTLPDINHFLLPKLSLTQPTSNPKPPPNAKSKENEITSPADCI